MRPAGGELEEAAAALRAGRLVVFPTETVYGVGANALDPQAVARLFAAKGRPPDNPLIVHVGDAAAARGLAAAWPERAERLARAFWPGPLTLVLPRAAHVPDATTAGLATVALRVPAHPVARELLRRAGVPVAAPSANRSGRPSPTRLADARADLGDAVAAYLDAGPTDVGVESTVVLPREDGVVVLRPGGVPVEDVARVAGPVLPAARDDATRSPGTRHRHYAPRAAITLVAGGRAELEAEAARLRAQGRRVAVVAAREDAPAGPDVRVPGARDDAAAWARALFATLRDLDAAGYDAAVVQEIGEGGLGRAVLDRLRRAAQAQR